VHTKHRVLLILQILAVGLTTLSDAFVFWYIFGCNETNMFVAVVDIGGIEGFQHPLALEVSWWIMIPVELVGVSVNQQCFGCITGRHV